MPKNRQRITIKPPFRGLLSGNNPGIDPHFLTKANNVYFDKQGIIVKKPGTTKLSEPPIHNPLSPLIFNATDKAIYTSQTWDNFAADQKIRVTGTQSNDGIYNVKEIAIALKETYGQTQIGTEYNTYGWFDNLTYLGDDTFLCVSRRDDTFYDGNIGYRLFKSTDSCETWEEVETLFEGFVIDEDHIITYLCSLGNDVCLMGYWNTDYDFSRVYRSADGGETWSLVLSLDEEYDYFNNCDISGSLIFITTFYGVIYKSIDAGLSWENVSDGDLYYINGITIISSTIAIAVGDNDVTGCLLRTTDGGNTWSLTEYGGDTITGIKYISGEIVIASLVDYVGQSKILKSINSGASWSEINVDWCAYKIINMDDSLLFALGYAEIKKSEDVGDTWSDVTVLNENFINSIEKIDETTLYATSSYFVGEVFKTEDSGDTWEEINPIFKFNLKYLYIRDLISGGNDSYLLACDFSNDPGKILKTIDGGDTWQDVRTDFGLDLDDISRVYRLVNLGDGIILGAANMESMAAIVRSNDNGDTWVLASIDIELTSAATYSICDLGDGIVLAGTSDESDTCYLLRSTTYGKTFFNVAADASVNLYIVDIIHLGSGIVLYVGWGYDVDDDYSFIFRSTTYGTSGSFTCVKTLTYSTDKSSIDRFYDLGDGIVLAVGGAYDEDTHILYRSDDYGATWEEITYTGIADDNISRIIDLGSGFCIGCTDYTDNLFYTTDYGATWTGATVSPSLWQAMVAMVNMNDGIVLAASYIPGNVFKMQSFYNALYVKSYETLVNEQIPVDLMEEVTTPCVYAITPIMGMAEYAKYDDYGAAIIEKLFVIDDLIIAEPYSSTTINIENIIKNDLTRDKIPDFAVLSNKIYIANGADTLQVYDGSTCDDIERPPQSGITGNFTPSMIEEHRDSLWAAGQPSNPSRLYKSCPYGPSPTGTDPFYNEDWDTNLATFDTIYGWALEGAAQIDIGLNDGTDITALVGNHFGQLIVFKKRSIYRIMGASKADFVLPPEGVIKGVGAYNNSVVRAHNNIYFVSEKGIHNLATVQEYGDNKETYLSLPIQEKFEKINKEQIHNCASIHWQEYSLILWAFQLTGSSNNDVLFVYNYSLPNGIDAWSVWTGLEIYSLALFLIQDVKILTLGDQLGRLCKFDFKKKSDLGSSYIAEIELLVDATDSSLIKCFRDIIIDFNSLSSSVDVKYKADNGVWSDSVEIEDPTGVLLGVFLLGTDLLTIGGRGAVVRSEINKSAKKLLINIQHNEINRDMNIFSIDIEAVSGGYH